MTRPFLLALLGLVLAAPPSVATTRSGQDNARPAQGKLVRAHAPKVLAAPARVAARPAVLRMEACDQRRGSARCRPLRSEVFTWAQGLPPAIGVQANECPAGTMATLAFGHEDVVRCIPI